MGKEIRIFWVQLPKEMKLIEKRQCLEVLDETELKIYEKYGVEFKKVEFLVGRLLLKSLLSQKLDLLPRGILFVKNKYGKLFLDIPNIARELKQPMYFNLSHTRGILVCGLSEIGEIGIDIETTDKNYFEIMQTVYVPKEIASVNAQTSPIKKLEMFYRIWTRKEAVMKAIGKGFSLSPLSFSVPTIGGRVDDGKLSFYTFPPTEGYLVSVAVMRSENIEVLFEKIKIDYKDLLREKV
jgi:4'-phosphopantetheinyl transferase